MLIGEINGAPAREHFLAQLLPEAGFHDSAQGFQMRPVAPVESLPLPADEEDDTEEGAGQTEMA